MHKMILKYGKYLLLTVLVLAVQTASRAQSDTLQWLTELMKVEGALTNNANEEVLKYETMTYYREVDTVEIFDTLHGVFYVRLNKYKAWLGDNTLIINNDDHNLIVDGDDGTLLLQKPDQYYQRLFQVDLFNEELRQMNVTGVQLTDSANIRRISFTCAPDAYLAGYDIYYDTTNYLPTRIRYNLRKMVYYSGGSYSNPDLISFDIHFFAYSSGSITDLEFELADHIIRQNGKYVAGNFNPDYEVIDLTQE